MGEESQVDEVKFLEQKLQRRIVGYPPSVAVPALLTVLLGVIVNNLDVSALEVLEEDLQGVLKTIHKRKEELRG